MNISSYVMQDGVEFDDTKALFNCGFYIRNPLENIYKQRT